MTLAYKPFKALLYIILGDNADPTILLALFHTGFNVVLALIWTPLLTPLMKLLQKLFPQRHTDLHLAIEHVNTTLPEEIIAAIHKDAIMLIEKVITYNRASVMLDGNYKHRGDHYSTLKQIEEKLLEFITYYTKFEFSASQASSLRMLHESIMDAISSAKDIKDVTHHLENIWDSCFETMNEESYAFFQKLIKSSSDSVHAWKEMQTTLDINILKDNIHTIIQSIHSDDDMFTGSLSANMKQEHSDSVNVAEIIKTNRYVLLSCEAILTAYGKWAESIDNGVITN